MAGMTKAKDALCIKDTVVTGAAASTNIAVTGIKTTDTLIAVWNLTDGTTLTSETTITSDGNIQHSTTSSATKKVGVLWCDNSA